MGSTALAGWLAAGHVAGGDLTSAALLIPIVSLIWFCEPLASWIGPWLYVIEPAEGAPPAWVVALLGWLILGVLALLAAY